MNTKPRYPKSLFRESALIGVIIGVLVSFAFDAIFTNRILNDPDNASSGDPFEMMICFWFPICYVVIAGYFAGVGAFASAILGRIGYSIRPTESASVVGAVCGGLVGPLLLLLLLLMLVVMLPGLDGR